MDSTHASRDCLANMTPDLPEIGFMEACLDWWMVYRSEDEMRTLISRIPLEEVVDSRTFRDPRRNVAFLEITKAP